MALRDQLVERARMLAAAGWLNARPQLGRNVFARGGAAGVNGTARARSTDLTALLRACLAALQAEVAKGERYRPAPLPLWRMPDAIARIRHLLPELPEASTLENAALWRFLPAVAPEPPELRPALPLGRGQHPRRRPRTRPPGPAHAGAGGEFRGCPRA
jgi:segregation and condensation protein A